MYCSDPYLCLFTRSDIVNKTDRKQKSIQEDAEAAEKGVCKTMPGSSACRTYSVIKILECPHFIQVHVIREYEGIKQKYMYK